MINIHEKPLPNGGAQRLSILDDEKFRIYADPIEGNPPGRQPAAYFSFKGNYPHLRIFLNNNAKGKDGMIDLRLDVPAMLAIVSALEIAVNMKEKWQTAIEVKATGWDRQNNKLADPYTAAVIVIGKDADLLEYIHVAAYKKPKLTFRFQAPEFHNVLDVTNNNMPASRQMVSALYVRAFIKFMNIMIPLVAGQIWDYAKSEGGKRDAWKAKQNGGGNNGGYNNNGNSYGSNNGGYNGGNHSVGNSYSGSNQPQPQYQAPQQQSNPATTPLPDEFANDIPF